MALKWTDIIATFSVTKWKVNQAMSELVGLKKDFEVYPFPGLLKDRKAPSPLHTIL